MKHPNNNKKKRPPQNTQTYSAEVSDSCFSKSVCSANDCTGLIPSLPSAQEELDAYEEMYQFCLDLSAPEDPPSGS